MAMNPVNPLDGLAAILRKRIASDGATKEKAVGQRGITEAPTGVQRPSLKVLKRKLELSIETIALDDPARDKKITRFFVESVLAWQFGDAIINDPGFSGLADEVQATLEIDPQFLVKFLASLPANESGSEPAIDGSRK